MSNSDVNDRQWPHSPSHLFTPGALYMVTAGTHGKLPLFDSPEKLDYLLSQLFEETDKNQWQLHAWAMMANHYHFIAQDLDKAVTLEDSNLA
jgi:REP-associated tyrosine transposase